MGPSAGSRRWWRDSEPAVGDTSSACRGADRSTHRPRREARCHAPAWDNGSVKIKPLRNYNLPDYSNHVVHFTGRKGGQMGLPGDVEKYKDWERLASIVIDGAIRAFPTFGNTTPVACFTESTASALRSVIGERYTACGIAFEKDVLFRAGGGPCFYVRGDHWDEVDSVLEAMRPFCTKFWPGVYTESYEELWELPPGTHNESQWAHEREWRVPGAGDPPGFRFGWKEIAFIVAPEPGWQPFVADWIGDWATDGHRQYFMDIRCVVLSETGEVISDPGGVFGQ
jgi:hypothetical protein